MFHVPERKKYRPICLKSYISCASGSEIVALGGVSCELQA